MQQNADLGIIPARRALNQIVTESLSSKHAAAGWAHVGLVPGERINRNKVLIDRFDECFQSKRSGVHLEETPQTKGAAALDLVTRVSPCRPKKKMQQSRVQKRVQCHLQVLSFLWR